MNTIKSELGKTTITTDYNEETNTVEICIGSKDGFRFINLNSDKSDHLIDLLNEFKKMIK